MAQSAFSSLTFNEWAVLLGVIAMVLIFVIPKIIREHNETRKRQKVEQKKEPVVHQNVLAKEITNASQDVIGYPQISGKGVKNLTPSDSMVKQYYASVNNEVPVNPSGIPGPGSP
jgi:predicted membrane protein